MPFSFFIFINQTMDARAYMNLNKSPNMHHFCMRHVKTPPIRTCDSILRPVPILKLCLIVRQIIFSRVLTYFRIKETCNFFTIIQLWLSPFSPHFSPLPYPPPTSHIQSSLLLSLSIGPLYMFLDLTLPLLSPVISLPSPI